MSDLRPSPSSIAPHAYRMAQLRELIGMPFDTPDRLGRLACLMAEETPEAACYLFLFDRGKRLLTSRVLFRGRRRTVDYYMDTIRSCARLERVKYIAAALRTVDVSCREEDFFAANRIALICQSEKLPVLEILWLAGNSYSPLFRRADIDVATTYPENY